MRTCIYLLSLVPSLLVSTLSAQLPEGFPVTDGLSLYVDGEQVVTNDQQVFRMIDRSGNGNDFYEGDGDGNLLIDLGGPPTEPKVLAASTPSGLDAIVFDGRGGYLEVPANPADFDGTGRTTITVFSPDALGLGRMIEYAYEDLGGTSVPRYVTHSIFADNRAGGVLRVVARNQTGGGAGNGETGEGTVTVGNYYIGSTILYDNGDLILSVINEAGELDYDGQTGADAIPQGHIWTRIGGGSEVTTKDIPGQFFQGKVAAVLVYDRALSTPEIESIENYLHSVYLNSETVNPVDDAPPVTDGLILHLNAANIVTNNDRVQQMTDLSGHGNHAEAKVRPPPSEPRVVESATPSGLPAVNFDGLGSFSEIASDPDDFDGPGLTAIAVYRPHTYGTDRIIDFAFTSLGNVGPRYQAHGMWAVEDASGPALRFSTRDAGGAAKIDNVRPGSLSSGNYFITSHTLFENGDVVGAVVNESNQRFSQVLTGMDENLIPSNEGHIWTRIGVVSNNTNGTPETFIQGELAAVLVYNRGLDSTEINSVEQYLHQVYLSPDTINPVDNNPPVTEGLVLHLNAANIERDGDRVLNMIDLSGNGNDAKTIVTGLGYSPKLIPGASPTGRNIVRFEGGQYLQTESNPAAFDGRAKTTLTVFRPNVFGTGRVIDFAYADISPDPEDLPNYVEHSMWAPGTALRIQNRTATRGAVTFSTEDGTIDDNTRYYLGVNRWSENGDSLAVVRTESNQRFTASASGADAEPSGHIWTRLGAGSSVGTPALNLFFNGDIAAAVVYNRELDDTELASVEQYLYERYMQGEPLEGFAAWVASFGLLGPAAAPDSQPAGDGVSNLIKYALGFGDPRIPLSTASLPAALIETIDSDEYLTLSVNKNSDVSDVTLFAETSYDLINWSMEDVVILEDTPELLRVRTAHPVGALQRIFLRLSLVLQE